MKKLTTEMQCLLVLWLFASIFALNSIIAQPQLLNPAGMTVRFRSSAAANAITFRAIGSNAVTSGAASYATSQANTISANALALAFLEPTLAACVDPTNLTGCGLTWTKITTTNWDSGIHRVLVYRAMTNQQTPSDVVTAYYTAKQDGHAMRVVEFGGVDTSGSGGSGAIVQVVVRTNSSTNPSITLGALTGSANAVVAYFGNVTNPFGGAAETDWVEDYDTGFNVPATGAYLTYRLATTDNTVVVTQGTGQQWGGIAIEVKVAP